MNTPIDAEKLRDALRDKKFLEFNYGVKIKPTDEVFSILCAFTANDICNDYKEYKGEK